MAGFFSNGLDVIPVGQFDQQERETIHLLFINGEISESEYRRYLDDAQEHLNK